MDRFIDGLSSILVFFLGEQANQKLTAQKPLLHLVITPGTIINIVHPLIIFMSVTLLPHSFSIWIQITIYLAFLLLFIKWCKYVTRLKAGLRKDNNNTMMPTMQICKKKEAEAGEEKISFFRIKKLLSSKVYEKESGAAVDELNENEKPHTICKPFVTLGGYYERRSQTN